MKVKIKYTSTRKFMVTLDNPTLGNVKEEIRKFVESAYKDSVKEPLTLSLNGRDPLDGSDDATLPSLGVVPGDMISIMPPDKVLGAGAGSEKEGVSDGAGPVGRGARVGEGSQPISSQREPVPQVGALGSCQQHVVPKIEEKPRYLLEARDSEPPSSLVEMMSECQPTSISQALNLVVHLTMLECGFQCEGGGGPPPGWQETVSTLRYNSPAFMGFTCTLVLVTMGEIKQVLASFPQQESEISVRLVIGDYTKTLYKTPVMASDLVRVSQLARTLRDRLLHPLQVSAHQTLGVPAPWHLAGLPQELLLVIAGFLDYKFVLALRETCQRLQSAMDDDKLWQRLYKRDFRSLYDDVDRSGCVDWKARYREAVKRRKDWRKLEDDGLEYVIPGVYPSQPFMPYHPGRPNYPGQPYPDIPHPRGPNPNPLQPHPIPNPFYDPDSPYFGGEVPPMPGMFPDLPNPLGPLGPRRPNPDLPFQPPFMPSRPRNPRGPRFDFF